MQTVSNHRIGSHETTGLSEHNMKCCHARIIGMTTRSDLQTLSLGEPLNLVFRPEVWPVLQGCLNACSKLHARVHSYWQGPAHRAARLLQDGAGLGRREGRPVVGAQQVQRLHLLCGHAQVSLRPSAHRAQFPRPTSWQSSRGCSSCKQISATTRCCTDLCDTTSPQTQQRDSGRACTVTATPLLLWHAERMRGGKIQAYRRSGRRQRGTARPSGHGRPRAPPLGRSPAAPGARQS